jgi:nucleoside-diphosphate-sugar epimerase
MVRLTAKLKLAGAAGTGMLRHMKVMVLGAAGFVGPSVVARLAALGHEPVALDREGRLRADRADPVVVKTLLAAHRPDAVIDLRAMTLEGTKPLLQVFAGETGRYVVASSGDVYRQYGGLHRTEPVKRQDRLAEDAPLRTVSFPYRGERPRPAADPRSWMDLYDKIPVEQAALAEPGLQAVVVRLPMVFGPGDRQRRFAWAIGPMQAGAPVLEVDAQWAAWRTTYGYLDDVGHGLALAAVQPAAAGVYNLGPLDSPDNAAWAGRIAELIGWTGELRRVPREALPEPARRRFDALDLSYPMVTDSRRIRTELGYAEVTDAAEALRRTIADEISRAA